MMTSNYNIIDNNNNNKNSNKSNALVSMHVRIKDLECGHYFYTKKGYNIQCGVVAIPKQDENDDDINNGTSLNEIEKVFNNNKLFSGEGTDIWLEDIMTFDDGYERFEKLETHYVYHYYWSHYREYTCTIGKNGNIDDVIFYRNLQDVFNPKYCLSENDCVSVCIDSNNYLYFLHSKPQAKKIDEKTSSTGDNDGTENNDKKQEKKNKKEKEKEKQKETANSQDKRAEKVGQILQFGLYNENENENDLEEYLSSLKHESTVVTRLGKNNDKDKKKDGDKDGDESKDEEKDSQHCIKLDFEKYNYLFAIASSRCDCDPDEYKGFKFEIFWE